MHFDENTVCRSDLGCAEYIPDQIVSDDEVQRIFNMFWATKKGVKCKRCGDEMWGCYPYDGISKEFPDYEKPTLSKRFLHSLSYHYYHPDCKRNAFSWFKTN
jgi:hypothetical protein